MITSRTNTFILSALVLTLCLGFIQADKWVTIESKKYGYKVDFPKKPTEQSQEVGNDAVKVKLNMYIYDASEATDDENLIYMSNCTQHASIDASSFDSLQLEEFYSKTIGGVVKGVKGELLTQKKIFLDGHEGREATIGYQEKQNTITLRLFTVNDKIYLIQYISETDKAENQSGKRFLDSFKIIKK